MLRRLADVCVILSHHFFTLLNFYFDLVLATEESFADQSVPFFQYFPCFVSSGQMDLTLSEDSIWSGISTTTRDSDAFRIELKLKTH